MKAILLIVMLLALVLGVVGFHHLNANPMEDQKRGALMDKSLDNLRRATFAGGCFWCVEADFEKLDGVVEVVSGYTGGHKDNPTYEEVSSGGTGHVEAVQVLYDPEKITYKDLLEVFWLNVDPTDPD
jgi:peptide methionine sulfoxide reductase msrA/msrB